MARIVVVTSNDRGRTAERWLRKDKHAVELQRPSSAERANRTDAPDLYVVSVEAEEGRSPEHAALLASLLVRAPVLALVDEAHEEEVDRNLPGLLDVLGSPRSEDGFLGRVDGLLRVQRTLFGGPEVARAPSEDEAPEPPPESGKRGLFGLFRKRPEQPSAKPAERAVRGPYPETLTSLVTTAEWRDAIDPGHGRRVASLCALTAAKLGLGHERRDMLLYAATVHDVGKVALRSELLRKPELSEADWKLVRFHPRRSAQLISSLTGRSEAAEIVLLHHERPDGRGYFGRGPDDVHPLSRILAVADAYDALTSNHARGPVLKPLEAIGALRAERGTAYDRETVDALTAVILRGSPGDFGKAVPIATRAFTTRARLR